MRQLIARSAGATGAVLLTLLAGGATATATAKAPGLGCRSGTLLFVDGPLRIVGVPFRSRDGRGHEEYACLGARGRPLGVGSTFVGRGVAAGTTPQFVFDGARYLAALQYSDSEGGPDANYDVIDLRTRRRAGFANASVDLGAPLPPVRVTTFGILLMPGIGESFGTVQLLVGTKLSRLSTAGATADAIALIGTTAYWTEQVGAAPPVARSASVRGGATAPENRLLEPVSIPAARSRCALRKGTTIAASPHVRVLRSGIARFVCRVASKRVTALGRQDGPLQIAADRWLLTRNRAGERERLVVLDTKTARTVTSAVVRAGAQVTLLADGTLAWLATGGPLEVQTPAATAPTLLAAATDAPSALASSAGTIYWTAAGAPQRFSVSSPP